MGFEKTGIDTIPADDEWAFQTEIRINSHSRPYLDWAADLAIMDGNKSVMLLIAKDAVGFANPNAHSYVNGSFYALDTTDTFHTYRVIKNMASVDLFVDNMVSPVVSVPYNDFQLWWDNTNMILLASTSTMGVANYDIVSFAYNLEGSDIPEPTTLALLALGGVALLRTPNKMNLPEHDGKS